MFLKVLVSYFYFASKCRKVQTNDIWHFKIVYYYVILYSDKKMNSSNCKNLKLKMENEEKQLIFIAVPQLRITNETGFVKKKFSTKKLKIVITIMY